MSVAHERVCNLPNISASSRKWVVRTMTRPLRFRCNNSHVARREYGSMPDKIRGWVRWVG